MNYGQKNHRQIAFVLLLTLSYCLGCQRMDSLPGPTEVTKTQRTQLGNSIRTVINTDTSQFFVLPKDYPEYRDTYNYLQELYNQAYYFLRDDWNAPSNDRWDTNRMWEVFILRSEDKMAFCLPGGDFYVTTAFLKILDYEYELYYIMTFEAVIMHHKYLLTELISFANNTSDLIELTESNTSSTNITIEELTDKLVHEITYTDVGMIQALDQKTNNLICEASFFDRFAILNILSKLEPDDNWLYMRPSYYNRNNFIASELEVSNPTSCGTRKWSNLPTDYTTFINQLP